MKSIIAFLFIFLIIPVINAHVNCEIVLKNSPEILGCTENKNCCIGLAGSKILLCYSEEKINVKN